MPAQEQSTILARFHDLGTGPISPRDIVHFLECENAKALQRISENSRDYGLGEECRAFLQEFEDRYSADDQIREMIEAHWHGVPLLFQLADAYRDLLALEKEHVRVRLNGNQRRRCLALADYMFRMRCDRRLIVSSSHEKYQIRLPRRISRRDLERSRTEVEETVLTLAERDGTLYFRYGPPRSESLNGFRFRNGYFTAVPAGDLRHISQNARCREIDI